MWVVLGGREAPAAVGLVGGCASSGIVALENSLSQNEESSLKPYPVYNLYPLSKSFAAHHGRTHALRLEH